MNRRNRQQHKEEVKVIALARKSEQKLSPVVLLLLTLLSLYLFTLLLPV